MLGLSNWLIFIGLYLKTLVAFEHIRSPKILLAIRLKGRDQRVSKQSRRANISPDRKLNDHGETEFQPFSRLQFKKS